MNEVCKMCFGSGFLIHGFVPPKPCIRCNGKGIIKTKKYNFHFYWIKLLRRKSLMGSSRLIFGWFFIIGIIAFFIMMMGLFYVWAFVK